MRVINEPRYEDFKGKIYRTQKECINAENNFVENVFQLFEELAKGCKKYGSECNGCPFYENVLDYCSIQAKTGDVPANWTFKEGE